MIAGQELLAPAFARQERPGRVDELKVSAGGVGSSSAARKLGRTMLCLYCFVREIQKVLPSTKLRSPAAARL
jgi:hypothetical protein